MTEILGACPTISEAAEPVKSVIPAHPHFGGKQPKQNRPPPKCISVICREEKEQLTEELEETKKELADALEELSKYLVCYSIFLSFALHIPTAHNFCVISVRT